MATIGHLRHERDERAGEEHFAERLERIDLFLEARDDLSGDAEIEARELARAFVRGVAFGRFRRGRPREEVGTERVGSRIVRRRRHLKRRDANEIAGERGAEHAGVGERPPRRRAARLPPRSCRRSCTPFSRCGGCRARRWRARGGMRFPRSFSFRPSLRMALVRYGAALESRARPEDRNLERAYPPCSSPHPSCSTLRPKSGNGPSRATKSVSIPHAGEKKTRAKTRGFSPRPPIRNWFQVLPSDRHLAASEHAPT